MAQLRRTKPQDVNPHEFIHATVSTGNLRRTASRSIRLEVAEVNTYQGRTEIRIARLNNILGFEHDDDESVWVYEPESL